MTRKTKAVMYGRGIMKQKSRCIRKKDEGIGMWVGGYINEKQSCSWH